MTWTLETKTQDVAPTKRGDEWRTLTTYHVKDDRGRHVTCVSAPSSHELLRPYQLSEQECAEAALLIAAAPELYEALRIFIGAATTVAPEIDPRGYAWSQAYLDQALSIARAALALLDAPARAEVEA